MPRLRYRKDWSFDDNLSQLDVQPQLNEVADANDGTESSYEEATTNTDTNEPAEGVSGASWLSNAAVIASLSDARLRGAVEYHKTMSRLLEQELCARRISNRGPVEIYRPSMFSHDSEAGMARRVPRNASRHGRTSKQRSAPTAPATAKLTTQQLIAALDMLTKLKGGA